MEDVMKYSIGGLLIVATLCLVLLVVCISLDYFFAEKQVQRVYCCNFCECIHEEKP